MIPEVGDRLEEARKLSKWVYDNLGPDCPVHFLRFHPDYKMMNLPPTPVKTLEEHCKIARAEGLRYVYIGNVSWPSVGAYLLPRLRSDCYQKIRFRHNGLES